MTNAGSFPSTMATRSSGPTPTFRRLPRAAAALRRKSPYVVTPSSGVMSAGAASGWGSMSPARFSCLAPAEDQQLHDGSGEDGHKNHSQGDRGAGSHRSSLPLSSPPSQHVGLFARRAR